MAYGSGNAEPKIIVNGRMESLDLQRRAAELIKEAEKHEKLSREASKTSAELALMAAELRRQARLLKTKGAK
jgi:hypothetical protein